MTTTSDDLDGHYNNHHDNHKGNKRLGCDEPLETRRKLGRLCMMYTIVHGLVDFNLHNYHSLQIFLRIIGRELSAWPANNCLQIMFCSCAMSSNFVSLPIIIFYICVNETTLFSFLQSLLVVAGRSLRLPKIFLKLGDQMIKQLLNSVIAKYLHFLASVNGEWGN